MSSSSQNASSSAQSQSQPQQHISLVGTMGLSPQLQQNMSILQSQLNPHQLAALQAQQRAVAQQVQPVVNVVSNQHAVAALQNVQVLGSNPRDGIGNVPISIITTGGQTYAVASNLQSSGHVTGPTQMQIRSIAPNAATVVNQIHAGNQQIHAGHLAVQQVRAPNAQQVRISNAVSQNSSSNAKQVQQVNLSLPLQSTTQTPASSASGSSQSQMLTKRKLQDLLHEIDPTETMDDDVEEVLLQIADDFIENVISSSCQIAKHRKSNTLEVKDVQLHLDRSWNMWIPGYGSEDLRPYKKLPSTEAHRQRLALIKKAMKK